MIYIQDPLFFSHIGDLVTIITKDRNNDQKFTFDDIVVLTKDFSAIAALVSARFFDSEFSFVIRGIAFMLVGAGFLAANVFLLRRRKSVA